MDFEKKKKKRLRKFWVWSIDLFHAVFCCLLPCPLSPWEAFGLLLYNRIGIVYRIIETIIEIPNFFRFDNIYISIYIYWSNDISKVSVRFPTLIRTPMLPFVDGRLFPTGMDVVLPCWCRFGPYSAQEMKVWQAGWGKSKSSADDFSLHPDQMLKRAQHPQGVRIRSHTIAVLFASCLKLLTSWTFEQIVCLACWHFGRC